MTFTCRRKIILAITTLLIILTFFGLSLFLSIRFPLLGYRSNGDLPPVLKRRFGPLALTHRFTNLENHADYETDWAYGEEVDGLSVRAYEDPDLARGTGWQVGNTFSHTLGGNSVEKAEEGYRVYSRPSAVRDGATLYVRMTLHDAERNQAYALQPENNELIHMISDIYEQDEQVWFYYLLAEEVRVDTHWLRVFRDPTRYYLEEPRMYQRRFDIEKRKAYDTEVCLPEFVTDGPYIVNVYEPIGLYLDTPTEDDRKQIHDYQVGTCTEPRQREGILPEVTTPLYELPAKE